MNARRPLYALSDEAVVIIRKRVAAGEKQVKVAKDFGVTQGCVSSIVNYRWHKQKQR